MISSRTYKVSKDGTVTADTKDAGDYVLLNEKDAKARYCVPNFSPVS